MPIDAGIALSGKPAQISSPMETAGQVMQLKNMAQQGQMQDLQIQQQRQAMMEDAKIRAALTLADGKLETALPEIMKISPTRGLAFAKSYSDQRDAELKRQKSTLEFGEAKTRFISQALMGAKDEESYQNALATIRQAKVEPGGEVPEHYDPQAIEALRQKGLTLEQQYAKARADHDQAMKDAEADHKKALWPLEDKEAQLKVQAAERTQPDASGLTPFQKKQLEQQAKPKPGVDVPFPPAVQAQREKTAASKLSTATQDIDDTAAAIMRGEAEPDLTKYSFRDRTAIEGRLARAGYNQTAAVRDWKAINKHLATLNGAQQERLRQAITFTYDSLDVIDGLWDQWQKTGLPTGFKFFNKAALAAAKQLPGETGAIAQALTAQLNDLTSELGTVYKGGNASTDETLRLAAENLKGDWNDTTFKKAIGLVRTNLRIRKNSITNSEAAGVSPQSPYNPKSSEKPASDPLKIF
jgi:hypothetical protein